MKSGALSTVLICLCLFIEISDTLELNEYSSKIRHKRSRFRRHLQNNTCTLPSHPDNGRWKIFGSSSTFKPRDEIAVNTVLQFECNVGYKLTASPFVVCSQKWKEQKLPECEVLCPGIQNTTTTISNCIDRDSKPVSCLKATEGTYLTYKCAPFYESPFGYKKSLVCSGGTWNAPKPSCQPVCGKKINDDTLTLAYGAVAKKVIEYPWITALYHKKEDKYENICGGSIISQTVVLTAAHCVTNDYGDVQPKENYLVAAGKYYNEYRDSRDPKAQYLHIRRIIVHERFRGESRRYFGDIAVLVTKGSFVLNELVQPVCFNDVNNIYLQPGNIGVVAGWGVKEGGKPSEELRTLEIPYKYETTCAQELPRDWADKYNMVDKICAGFHNKSTSVCSGDSGSGLYFKNSEDNRYYIHGLVSLAPSKNGTCDIQQNSLYTKIAYHYEFVDREVTKHVYVMQDCLLPSYPANGRWEIENSNKRPGQTVPSNTLLRASCNKGFKLSSESSTIQCDSSFNMPSCQLLCPMPKLPPVTDYSCKNKQGEKIICGEAVEETSLTYVCPVGYISEGIKHFRLCTNGSWGVPPPHCERVKVDEDPSKRGIKTSVKVFCVYAMSRYSSGDDIPANLNVSLCTHIIFSHLGLWSTGLLKTSDNPFSPEGNRTLYHRVASMKEQNRNLQVLLRVYGKDESKGSEFQTVAADPERRAKFVDSVTAFLDINNFDGLDIDWDVPHNKTLYKTLLKETSEALKRRDWMLTVSVYFTPIYIYPDIDRSQVDWIIVKSYGFATEKNKVAGQYSTLYQSSEERQWEQDLLNIDSALSTWSSYANQERLVLTIAFYGIYFTLKDPDENEVHSPVDVDVGGTVVPYSEICQKYVNWTRVWDDEQKNPYKYSDDKWLGYDDTESVKIKAAYIKKKRLKALSVYSIEADDVDGKCGPKQVLLKYVHAGLRNKVDLN